MDDPTKDTIPRSAVEYICRKNTVSTNPYEHKYHDKFIQFMDDPEISDFGRWQQSNGFNTALVAVWCDLDKVPSVTPKQPGWIPVTERLPKKDGDYLVTTHSGQIARYIFIGGSSEEYWRRCATAWMPLPTPYLEGETG